MQFAAEQFHARRWRNNATRLSTIEWLWREREWGHRRQRAAGPTRRTHPCASISSAMTASRCAARYRVVTSKEELQAAPLNGKRLLALWNALPGVDKRRK